MILFTLMTLLIGAVLGFHFKIPILAPAIILCLASAFILSIGHGPWSALITAALAITALQIGYIGGSVFGSIVMGARIRKISPASGTVAQKSAH